MQSRYPIIFFCFFLILACTAKDSFGQAVNEALGKADALFTQKKYTESLNHYEQVLAEGMATPQMLLKMAYIKEGLEEYPDALYYLTEYYNLTHNRQVLTKINEIAAKQGLLGYELTDADFVKSWYQLHSGTIFIVLMTILFLLFLLQAYKVWKGREFSSATATWQVVFAIILVAGINYPVEKQEAIISEPSTYLMKGPSAGAPLQEMISNGHKVKVLDEGEVWTKIEWRDTEVYVRSSSIKRLG